MNLDIKIECLREPNLLFGGDEAGVEPRRVMAKAGAADSATPKKICIGLVGPAQEVQLARRWLPRLNNVAIAREKSARRYRDWPGAQKAFGTTFVVEDRFVRALDPDRLTSGVRQVFRRAKSLTSCLISSTPRYRACSATCGRTALSCVYQTKLPI